LIREWGVILALLLLMFVLRVWNLSVQDAYLDEGLHIRRALEVWSFEQNPGRFAHGKLLLYFWVGLFARFADIDSVLWISRLSMACFSIVTGLSIYALGRRCSDHATGVVALAVYSVLPMSIYYERMVMADPMASGLVVLVVLVTIAVVRRPTLGSAVSVGVLIALATMAKMVVLGIVLLPGFIAFDAFEWRRGELRIRAVAFLRRYAPWMAVTVLIVVLAWSPIVVPAIATGGSDTPFVLFHPDNVSGGVGDRTQPSFGRMVEYARGLLPLVAEYTSWGFLVAVGVALTIGLLTPLLDSARTRFVLALLQWMILVVAPTWLMATLITARYFVPVLPPLCLVLAIVGTSLWRRGRARWLTRGVLAVSAIAWLTLHALPFTATALSDPYRLPFHGTNYTENIAGFFQSDLAVRKAAETLNRINPDRVAATWNLCHLIFFHLDRPPQCLRRGRVASDIRSALDKLPGDSSLYLAFSDYPPFFEDWHDVQFEVIAAYQRERIHRPVSVVRLWR